MSTVVHLVSRGVAAAHQHLKNADSNEHISVFQIPTWGFAMLGVTSVVFYVVAVLVSTLTFIRLQTGTINTMKARLHLW